MARSYRSSIFDSVCNNRTVDEGLITDDSKVFIVIGNSRTEAIVSHYNIHAFLSRLILSSAFVDKCSASIIDIESEDEGFSTRLNHRDYFFGRLIKLCT